jgi:hypothetical protein
MRLPCPLMAAAVIIPLFVRQPATCRPGLASRRPREPSGTAGDACRPGSDHQAPLTEPLVSTP